MQYKAIFDLPDDIIPPSVVGFQVITPTYKVVTFTAVMQPMLNNQPIEDGKFKEVENNGNVGN